MESLWQLHDRYKHSNESARKEIEAELTIRIRDFFQGANPFHHNFVEIIMDEYCKNGKQSFSGFEDPAPSAASSPGTLMPMSPRSEAAAELVELVADMDVPPLSLDDSVYSAPDTVDQEKIIKSHFLESLSSPPYCVYCGDPSAPDLRISMCDHGYCPECYEQLVSDAKKIGMTARCKECGKGPLALKPISIKPKVFEVAEAALLPPRLISSSTPHTQDFLSSPIWMPASPRGMNGSAQPNASQTTLYTTTSSPVYIPDSPQYLRMHILKSSECRELSSGNTTSPQQGRNSCPSPASQQRVDMSDETKPMAEASRADIQRSKYLSAQKRGIDQVSSCSDMMSRSITAYDTASITAKKRRLHYDYEIEDIKFSSGSDIITTDEDTESDTSDEVIDWNDFFDNRQDPDEFARRALASPPLPRIRDITSEESYSDDEEFESAVSEHDYECENDSMLNEQEQDIMENMGWVGSDLAEDAVEQASFGERLQMQAMSFGLEGEASEDAAEALYGMY